MQNFKNDLDEPDKIYVVERRDSKEEPLGGWKCFNAMIIAVSGKFLKSFGLETSLHFFTT